MDNAQSLIRKARALESAGQDEGALGCYLEALTGSGAEPDVNLLARAGVLQLRLGRVDEAAETLARASDLYAGAGMRNNALALCHRVLRVDAQRADFLRRIGELSALQGYRADARRGLTEYASLVEASDAANAAAALRGYLDHFPDDAAVKARLSELTGEEHAPAPVSTPAAAERTAPAPVVAAPAVPAADDFGMLTSLDEEDGAGDDLPVLSSEPAVAAREADPGIMQIEGLEPTHTGGSWSDADRGGDALELMGNALEPSPSPPAPPEPAPAPAPEPVEEPLADEPEEDVLPLLAPEPTPARPDPAPEEEAPPAAEPSPADVIAGLRGRLAADPADLAAHERLVEALSLEADAGLDEALAAAHTAFAAAGQYVAAADYAERLTLLRPGDPAALQAWAEHAFRSGDRARLIAAYLGVARRFAEAGQGDPARKIYERVLKLDAKNEEALEGLGSAAPPEGDYVDFGSMVLEDEASTRFQVEAGFPSGDEEKDFREILAVFRDQIASGIDAADTASHYDLGIAFKEMGLWDDAVTQLQRALRAGSNPLATLELLGECYYQKGDHEMAVRMLERATKLPGTEPAALEGVHQWLGRAREALRPG